jgi:hypothetical protein
MADGRYKAVRVLRRQGTYSVVYTCSYLGKARPAIDDPLLRKVVIQRRFFFKRVAARYWLEGKPPRSFELLGNLPLTKKEAAIRCNSGAGRWDATSGDEAFLEWRWIHDRPAFEEERRREEAERERIRLRPQKPRKMMSVREFWTIIGLLDWKRQGNDKKVLAPAVKALAAKPEAEILAFQERLAYLLYRLDTRAHAQSMRRPSRGKESDFFSADGFLYARCVVVANGRALYEMVQKDPTKMPRGLEFEAILGLAPDAFELKTGRRFEYSTGCSYESFSNPIGWRE